MPKRWCATQVRGNRCRLLCRRPYLSHRKFPVILENGKLNPIYAEARQRGVIFDIGHGGGSFWFRNAVPAIKQGFIPDSISTDPHMGSVNGPVVDMITTMSKVLAMGVPLEREPRSP
jgi:dihydroorotase